MYALSHPSQISIHEINAAYFASLCWEVHPAVRDELADYLRSIVKNECGTLFAAFDAWGECAGRVAVELHPGYLSRGKPCPTFGWLDGEDGGTVTTLLETAASWSARFTVSRNGTDKHFPHLRGPVSLPKNIGGMGCQIEGFQLPRMHSVSTNRPELAGWIEEAGFKPDAPYACVDVSDAPRWESATLPTGYSIVHWTQDEWQSRANEVLTALQDAFGGILPDSSGPERLGEALDTMSYHPDSKYMNPVALGPDGKIAGAILCTPNLYEAWDRKPVTGVNVDTIFISPQHRGVGIMSALNNLGRFNTRKYLGWTHVEGTSIWLANEKAVMTIFPHGHICRRHVMFQKRLKKTTNGEA